MTFDGINTSKTNGLKIWCDITTQNRTCLEWNRSPPSGARRAGTRRASLPWRSPSSTGTALTDLLEIAMPSQSALEAAGASDAVGNQRLAAVVPFLNQPLAYGQSVALDRGTPVSAHAHLREASDFLRQLLGLGAGTALGGDVFAQADLQTLLGRHLSSRQDDLKRPALADDPRQADGAAVDQRHAPAAAIDAEIGFFGHHPKIAPQPQFHSARNGRPFDGADYRLVQFQPRRPERPARNFAAIAARPRRRDVE